jgi:hypothetical protein
MPNLIPGVSMMRCASIGIALLALSLLAFASVSFALAQAGSTGGSIGKRDKSISGGEEEAERPRAAPRAKRPAAANANGVNSNGVNISGVWGSNIGAQYRITQSGNTFRWVVVQGTQTETGNGTLNGYNVSASWSGTNGSRNRRKRENDRMEQRRCIYEAMSSIKVCDYFFCGGLRELSVNNRSPRRPPPTM